MHDELKHQAGNAAFELWELAERNESADEKVAALRSSIEENDLADEVFAILDEVLEGRKDG